MIGVIFQFGSQIVEVRIDGTNCLFRTGQFGGAFAPIDALQLSYDGVIKEFPELKDRKDWKEQAIKRFKDKMNTYKTEEQRIDYIVEDLKKYGYIPLYKQRQGFRIEKFKEK